MSNVRAMPKPLIDLGFLKSIVILNCVVPALVLCWDAYRGQLGANAANQALHITGILSLVFLFLSLAITPVKSFTGWASLIAVRRALGLSGFAYAFFHLVIYFAFDRNLDLSSTISEILSRRFLQVGFLAVLLMIPLAVTSTNSMIRWLGAKRWKLLHRAAYVVAILGVAHYYLLVKSDVRQPLAFAAVLTPLLLFRVYDLVRSRRSTVTASSKRLQSLRTPDEKKGAKIWKGALTVQRVIDETQDVKTFRFGLPSGDLPFEHTAGQFLSLQLLIDGKIVRRSYTISSSPHERGYCEITVKRDGLASQFLHSQIREGAQIEIAAPAGKFCFRGSESKRLVLIGGGVGITPLMSITRWLQHSGWGGEIDFFQVSQTEADLIFDAELRTLASQNPQLRLHCVLTRTTECSRPAHFGRLTAPFLQKTLPHLRSSLIYLCGPTSMMEATKALLTECGVADDAVRTEAFAAAKKLEERGLGSEAATPELAASATITFLPRKIVCAAAPGATVLETAEDAGVEIPFECRAGVCGQCKVRCESGSVSMASRSALSDREMLSGFILACQATPTSSELCVKVI
jgi:ferredoxin-NADP reductase/DMSO/TMAO reductase YedYZ heme-binding membrane subunit